MKAVATIDKSLHQNWHAIYTKPRFEKKVYQTLTTNGFECYLPLITTMKQWSDRKKKVELPLIPSYIFIYISEQNLNNILSFNGVVRILKHLKKPAIIQNHEIENLKILLKDSENIIPQRNLAIKKGDIVEVEKGIFKGLVAECIEIKGKYRIITRIEALNNIIEVNIPLSFIKKCS